jgi:hypothetical protein
MAGTLRFIDSYSNSLLHPRAIDVFATNSFVCSIIIPSIIVPSIIVSSIIVPPA